MCIASAMHFFILGELSMKTKICVLLVSMMLLILLYGCSKTDADVSNKTTASLTTTIETTTEFIEEPTTVATTQQGITTT